MACQLHCPNCGEDLGKDTENAKSAYCSNCGEDKIYNERGYNADGSNDNAEHCMELDAEEVDFSTWGHRNV